jgi:hypothetical protein
MRRLVTRSLLAVIAIAVSGVAPAPPASAPASRATAASARSALERKYPLGSQPLCCSSTATRPPTSSRMSSGDSVDLGRQVQGESGRLLQALIVLLAVLALAWGWMAWRFAWSDGHLERRRVRRRWPLGHRTYRLAQSLGFRHSASRDALVPGLLDGRFGPVLRLRRVLSRPGPETQGFTVAGHDPVASAEPPDAIDIACLPLPSAHRDATLWQLTAADACSQVVCAELVRRRAGPPTTHQVAAFVHRVAANLAATGRQLDTIVMHPGAGPAEPFHHAVLPAGVRLVRVASSDLNASIAAEVHHLLVARHWRSAFMPPAAPPLAELQQDLARWVGVHNAERGDALRAARRIRTGDADLHHAS